MNKLRRLSRWLSKHIRWWLRIFLVLLVMDLSYLTYIWPDWSRLAAGPIPKTNFIHVYEKRRVEKDWPVLRWSPVPFSSVPKSLQRAVLVAEDSRFYTHNGLDLIAIKDAWDYNMERGQLLFGASTISQQTAKNLFLNPSRNPVRKWHEIILTIGLERHLSKQRIFEIYLNTAEFGRGIYGVQAAAEAYWGIPASRLSVTQAAELAATLPGPVKNNPAVRSDFFLRRTKKILGLMGPRYTAPEEGRDPGIGATREPDAIEAPPATDPPTEQALVPEPAPTPPAQEPLPGTSRPI
jgi:monofunctional biosynthetic peptidoglycan transglycosylase